MTEELSKKLIDIADKLGTTTEIIVETTRKQIKIDFIFCIIWGIIFLLFMIPLVYWWIHLIPQCKPQNPKGQYSFERNWATSIQIQVAICTCFSLVSIIGFLINFSTVIQDGITLKYNPKSLVINRVSLLINPKSIK